VRQQGADVPLMVPQVCESSLKTVRVLLAALCRCVVGSGSWSIGDGRESAASRSCLSVAKCEPEEVESDRCTWCPRELEG
jgi:hypothetical protein